MKAANNIKIFRESKGITREQMRRKLNMSLSSYAKIERGEGDIPLSMIRQIAQVFEIDAAFLIVLDVSMFSLFVNTPKLLFAELTEKNNYIQKYIKMLEEENKRLTALVP